MRRSSNAVAAMRSSAGGVASLDELSHLSLSARFLIGKFRASLLVAFKLMLCEVIGGVFIVFIISTFEVLFVTARRRRPPRQLRMHSAGALGDLRSVVGGRERSCAGARVHAARCAGHGHTGLSSGRCGPLPPILARNPESFSLPPLRSLP